MSQQPPRHGHGGFSTLPVNIQSRSKLTPVDSKQFPNRIIKVDIGNLFLRSMPNPSAQQICITNEAWFDYTKVRDEEIVLGSDNVTEGQIYVITDVEFYAIGPSSSLFSQPIYINSNSLSGSISFDILFSSMSPLRMQGNVISVYAGENSSITNQSGWPFLNKKFGSERSLTWGIFANENVEIKALARIIEPPRNIIYSLGYRMNGFSIMASDFNELLKAGKFN